MTLIAGIIVSREFETRQLRKIIAEQAVSDIRFVADFFKTSRLCNTAANIRELRLTPRVRSPTKHDRRAAANIIKSAVSSITVYSAGNVVLM